MENLTVGVLGGLGPMASVYFYEMVVNMTDAKKDQEHVDMIIASRATTPDRTAFIMGDCEDNPASALVDDAKKLQKYGVDFVVMTCNTAHYFYDKIVQEIDIPLINIIEETIKHAKKTNHKKLAILATDGNIKTNLYQDMCKKYDIDFLVLDETRQSQIMQIIYGDIKSGKPADMEKFNKIINYVKENDCDGVILGCTELSILKNDNNLDGNFYIDSLEVLARETIIKSKRKLK